MEPTLSLDPLQSRLRRQSSLAKIIKRGIVICVVVPIVVVAFGLFISGCSDLSVSSVRSPVYYEKGYRADGSFFLRVCFDSDRGVLAATSGVCRDVPASRIRDVVAEEVQN